MLEKDYLESFLYKIVIIRNQVLELNIDLNKTNKFKNVAHSFDFYFRNLATNSPALDIYFNCELPKLIKDDIHTLALDISIYKENEIWFFDGNVNWYGYNIGGITQFNFVKKYSDISVLLEDLENNYKETEEKFLFVVNSYFENNDELGLFFNSLTKKGKFI